MMPVPAVPPELLDRLRAYLDTATMARHDAAVKAMEFNVELAKAQGQMMLPDGLAIDVVAGKIVELPRGAP